MTWWAKFSSRSAYAPTALSLFRGVLGLSLPFLLLHPDPRYRLSAAVLFAIGAATDYYDGLLARRHDTVSDFGKIIDPTMDKLLVLAPLACFAAARLFSPWWLVPIFFREIVVSFCRIGWYLEGKAVAAEKLGKIKFGFQCACVTAGFVYYFFPRNAFFGALTMALLAVSAALTVVSGLSFVISNRALFASPFFAKFTAACGVGLIPGPAGTWGSLLGLALVPLTIWSPWLYAAVFLFFFAAGSWGVSRLGPEAPRDPHYVVVDEVLGMMTVFLFARVSGPTLLAGFLLFRLFDVLKPFPIRRLEDLPGYWGILVDDLAAGLLAGIITRVFFR